MLSSDLLERDFDWGDPAYAQWHVQYSNGTWDNLQTDAEARTLGNRVYMDVDADFLRAKMSQVNKFLVWLKYPRVRGNFSYEKSISSFEAGLMQSTLRFCVN